MRYLILVAAAIGLASNASGQLELNGWRVLACTWQSPEGTAGMITTIYFSETQRVVFGQKELPAAVSKVDIVFDSNGTRWTISRITGRFAAVAGNEQTMVVVSGTCEQAEKPKF